METEGKKKKLTRAEKAERRRQRILGNGSNRMKLVLGETAGALKEPDTISSTEQVSKKSPINASSSSEASVVVTDVISKASGTQSEPSISTAPKPILTPDDAKDPVTRLNEPDIEQSEPVVAPETKKETAASEVAQPSASRYTQPVPETSTTRKRVTNRHAAAKVSQTALPVSSGAVPASLPVATTSDTSKEPMTTSSVSALPIDRYLLYISLLLGILLGWAVEIGRFSFPVHVLLIWFSVFMAVTVATAYRVQTTIGATTAMDDESLKSIPKGLIQGLEQAERLLHLWKKFRYMVADCTIFLLGYFAMATLGDSGGLTLFMRIW